jgi:hypothetical protein
MATVPLVVVLVVIPAVVTVLQQGQEIAMVQVVAQRAEQMAAQVKVALATQEEMVAMAEAATEWAMAAVVEMEELATVLGLETNPVQAVSQKLQASCPYATSMPTLTPTLQCQKVVLPIS